MRKVLLSILTSVTKQLPSNPHPPAHTNKMVNNTRCTLSTVMRSQYDNRIRVATMRVSPQHIGAVIGREGKALKFFCQHAGNRCTMYHTTDGRFSVSATDEMALQRLHQAVSVHLAKLT
jgi:polyribonucleotide nucleotidyltransferase